MPDPASPETNAAVPVGEVIGAYLASWARRREVSGLPVAYGKPEADVWVGFFYIELMWSLVSRPARSEACRQAVAHAAVSKGASPTPNVAGYVLATAREDREVDTTEGAVREALTEGGQRGSVSSLLGTAWRVAFLATLSSRRDVPELRAELDQLEANLRKGAAALDGWTLQSRAEHIGATARLAHALLVAGGASELADIRDAGLRAVETVEQHLGTQLAERPTAELAQLCVASRAAGWDALCDRLVEHLLAERLDPERGLLRTAGSGGNYDSSAWTPLALIGHLDRSASLDAAFQAIHASPQPDKGTAPEPGALPRPNRRSRIAATIAAYLDNWAMRREGSGLTVVYGRPEADVWVGLLHAMLVDRFPAGIVRAVARREAIAHAALTGDDPPPTPNVAGYVLAATLEDSQIADPEGPVRHALEAGGQPRSVASLLGIAWRIAFLGRLRARHAAGELANGLTGELAELTARLERGVETLRGWELESRAQEVGPTSRLAHGLHLAAMAAELPEAQGAAHRVVKAVGSYLTDPTEEEMKGVPTTALAQVAIAAEAVGDGELRDRVTAYLLDLRLDAPRGILRSSDADDAYDFSPWSPLALLPQLEDLSELEGVLDPPAPPPPSYALTPVPGREDALEFRIEDDGAVVSRAFGEEDFDILLAQILSQLEALGPGELSPRLHGHVVIGLLDLLEIVEDPATTGLIEDQVARSLDLILEAQEPSGGWRYSRTDVPSVIYSAGSAIQSEFADHPYTIDVAVPGTALILASRRKRSKRYLDAAHRAFTFLERDVGRIDWEGKQVWRLYPGDEKTAKQGTAVNYELWVGLFLAGLAAASPKPAIVERARAYIDDIVAYASGHLRSSGDIAYGDYVAELRTPYASWDAYLLAEIARLADHRRAGEMSREIVERLAEIQLPSGAIPNVVNFEEHVEGLHRWRVHRHGIGPYPMRGYYQLYFVGAASATGIASEAATKALGFVLVEMYRRPFGDMSSGYFADGRFDDRPDSLARIGRDWLLVALAALPRISDVAYRPRLSRIRRAPERLLEAVEDLAEQARQAVEEEGWSWVSHVAAARGAESLTESGDPDAKRIAASIPLPDAAPAPPPLKLKTEHPAHLADSLLRRTHDPKDKRGVASIEAGLDDLLGRQQETGLWSMRHRPGGDERQADVLLALFELLDAGLRTDALTEALWRGVSGAWSELFVASTGAGLARPRARTTAMHTRLVFRHALCFTLASRTLGMVHGNEWARWALRHVVLTGTGVDGRLLVGPERELDRAESLCQSFEGLSRLFALAPDLAGDPPIRAHLAP